MAWDLDASHMWIVIKIRIWERYVELSGNNSDDDDDKRFALQRLFQSLWRFVCSAKAKISLFPHSMKFFRSLACSPSSKRNFFRLQFDENFPIWWNLIKNSLNFLPPRAHTDAELCKNFFRNFPSEFFRSYRVVELVTIDPWRRVFVGQLGDTRFVLIVTWYLNSH